MKCQSTRSASKEAGMRKGIECVCSVLVLLVLAAMPVFAGGSAEEAAEAEAVLAEPQAIRERNHVFDPSVTVSTVIGAAASVNLPSDETLEDNVHTDWLRDELGIDVDYHWSVGDTDESYRNQIRLTMAAGDEMPDFLTVSDRALAADLMESGLFMADVTEAVRNYLDPRAQDVYFEEYPSVWDVVLQDGNRRGYPKMSDGNAANPVMWVRQDWLDDLGLDAPTNIEEFETVMEAFVEHNDHPDAIGMSLSGRDGINMAMGNGGFIFGQHQPEHWIEDENGDLVYASVTSEAREGLAILRDWFDRGLIDREFGVLDQGSSTESFQQGRSGIVFGQAWMNGWPLNLSDEYDVEEDVRPYPIPAGMQGEVGFRGTDLAASITLFNRDISEAALQAFFLAENYYLSWLFGDDDTPFYYGWFEGYDYIMGEDGTPIHAANAFPEGQEPVSVQHLLLRSGNPNLPGVKGQVFEKIAAGEPMDGSLGAYEWVFGVGNPLRVEAGLIVEDQMQYSVRDLFTGSPTPEMVRRGELVDRLELEAFTRIIYGQESLDYFDRFVDDWYSSGGEQITAEVNEWWQSVQ